MSTLKSQGTRVWDRFLTEQDKAHLAFMEGELWGGRVGFGTKPALLLIDLYRAVFGDEPLPLLEGIKTWPRYCGMVAWNAIPNIQKLLAEARRVGIPVIHITSLTGSGMPGWVEAAHRDVPRQPADTAALERKKREADIIPEVGPIKGEVVLKKTAPSAFWGTPLIGQLTYLGVDTILVAGEVTSGCVRATVVDGCANRFRMQVVEECVFDRHEATHAMNLFDMHEKYADVISLNEALNHLRNYHPSKTV